MKISRRKLTLQLTPLLDLMLIVFFLQYLQMRETTARREQAAVAIEQNATRLADELGAAREAADQLSRELEEQRQRANNLQSVAAAERMRVDQLIARENDLGRLVTELFNVPEADLEKVLSSPAGGGVARSPQEIAALRKQFQDLASAKSGRMIKHLLVFDEIRKRCDVWEMFIDDQHVVTLNTGARTATLRLNLTDDLDPDVARFEQEFVEMARALPDPKSLVIVLMTYDRGTRLIVTEALSDAMPRIMRKLAEDTRGQVRFEFADLGIRIDPGL